MFNNIKAICGQMVGNTTPNILTRPRNKRGFRVLVHIMSFPIFWLYLVYVALVRCNHLIIGSHIFMAYGALRNTKHICVSVMQQQ